MNADVINTFIKETKYIFKKNFNISLSKGELEVKRNGMKSKLTTCAVELSGLVDGCLSYSMEKDLLIKMSKTVNTYEAGTIDLKICTITLLKICKVISKKVNKTVSKQKIKVSSPDMIAKGISPPFPEDAPIISISFITPNGNFFINCAYVTYAEESLIINKRI